MSDSKLEEQAPVLDSETSLDYYVTTVNEKKAIPDSTNHLKEENSGIVVSVDRAGSVKVRKRKKSKRRKKKSNLALEEIGIRASDDGILYRSSGSDGSQKKMPRRSASVCEKDLRKNSKVVFADMPSYYKQLNGDITSEDQQRVEVVVRKRVKKKTSFKNDRRDGDAIFDKSKLDVPPKTATTSPNQATSKQGQMPSQGSQRSLSSLQINNVDMQEPVKKFNRQDALDTINAFVMEVQEATTVAKQQEQKEERNRDPVMRSHSLSEIVAEETDTSSFDPNDRLPDLPELKILPTHKPPVYGHQKSESIGQRSVASGSVFMSDPDASVDENSMPCALHPPVMKTSSEETKGRCTRSHSLFDIVMDPNANSILSEMMSRRMSRNQSTMCLSGRTQTQPRRTKDYDDYGIAHLEQVCKLVEQIGDLRNQNQALVKRVHQLEAQVKELKDEKGSNSFDSTIPDSYQTLPKRAHPVGRLRDVITRSTSRSRKSSFERPQSSYEMKGCGEPFPLASSFGVMSQDRPTAQPNLSMKKTKPAYSRDDLELSSKGRWKFWKAPSKSTDPHQSSRKRIQTLRTEQSPTIHSKDSNVAIDSLNNINSDFSQKKMQFQSSRSTSRASSRASEFGLNVINKSSQSNPSTLHPLSSDDNLRFKVHRMIADEKPDATHKRSFRERLSKWEKAAAKRFSLDKRSKSVDKMNALNDRSTAEPNLDHHNRTMSARADFHKSMPCVMTASTESRLKQLKRNSVHNSVGSVEWSGLQEAFPTNNHLSGKPLSRLLGASHSRLASPLRKKNSQAHKRRSWSFSKKPSSRYYLPNTGDLTLGSNLELAESIGEQFTLEIDQDDVKGISTGVNDEELNHLKKNTADLRDKLSEIESIYKEPTKAKVRPRPASSLARYHAERNALSFRRSKHVETLRLSSCEVLSTPKFKSPLVENIESPLIHHSWPDLSRNQSDDATLQSEEQESSDVRRYTVTIMDRKRPNANTQCRHISVPSATDASRASPLITHPRTLSVGRKPKAVMKPSKAMMRWNSTKLQHSRSVNESFVADSGFAKPVSVSDGHPDNIHGTLKKKKSTVSGRILHGLPRMSQKLRQRNSLRKNPSSEKSEKPLQPKKKHHRIFSFKDKNSPVEVSYSTDERNASKFQKEATISIAMPQVEQNGQSSENKPTNHHQQKRRKSEKIVEISERLTEDSRPRCDSSPPHITKGLVGRLSKRFNRPRKETRTTNNSKTTPPKSALFLNAKNHFELKSHDESSSPTSNINNHNNTHSQLYLCKRSS